VDTNLKPSYPQEVATVRSIDDPAMMRRADPALLAQALVDGRAQLLSIAQAWRDALGPSLNVPCQPELNLPLWELGHIGWFETWWIARNPQRHRGNACPAELARPAAPFPGDDEAFNSSWIAHADRWRLTLPSFEQTLERLAVQREQTLALLAATDDEDAACYFPRLALFHEDMHREAWLHMSQTLGVDPGEQGGQAARAPGRLPPDRACDGLWIVPAGVLHTGRDHGGFMFDNELGEQRIDLPSFAIDRRAVTCRRICPSSRRAVIRIPAGGMPQGGPGWPHGRAHAAALVRRPDGGWDRQLFGRRRALAPEDAAVHLTAHEARARAPGRPTPAHRVRVGVGRAPGPGQPTQPSNGARSGSRPRAPSRPGQDSNRTPIGTTRRPGSTVARCCAVPPGQPRRECATHATGTSSRPSATTSSRAFAASQSKLGR
jgi:hypothetical protein